MVRVPAVARLKWRHVVLLAVCLLPARLTAAEVEGRVASVRGDRIYLELSRPIAVGEQVVVTAPGEEPRTLTVIATSSRFLVIERDGLDPQQDERLRLGEGARPEEPAEEAEAETVGSDIRVGRSAPTLAEFQAAPQPERALVPFSGGAPTVSSGEEPGLVPLPGEDGRDPAGETAFEPAVGPNGEELTPGGRVPNDARGEMVVGIDAAIDDEADISRTTPYARLRLAIHQLGGSDRARLIFYGSVRQPFDGTPDWTGRRDDHLVARLSALAVELDAVAEHAVESFTDRLELGIGRNVIPGVSEAGVVDGVRAGVRFGGFTPFAFAGAAASANPRREDYDSVVFGGGVRYQRAFAHAGALRLSLAGAQERYRGEGERDFVEAHGNLRLGAFGVRGDFVLDFFDAIIDDESTDITTAALSIYAQATAGLRFELGYRERRPRYQRELLDQDLDPIAVQFLERDPRRNWWGSVLMRFSRAFQVRLRGEHYQGREARDASGASLRLTFRPVPAHRLIFELAARRRLQRNGAGRSSTDPFLLLGYSYLGEATRVSFSVAYRDSLPRSADDQRLAFRLSLDKDVVGGFGLRGYGQLDFRRLRDSESSTRTDGLVGYLGFGARYRF